MDGNSKCHRLFLTRCTVMRQAVYLGKPPDEPRVRAVSALPVPLVDKPGVPDAVRGPRARTVVTIAVPQAAVVYHSPEVILMLLCRPLRTKWPCCSPNRTLSVSVSRPKNTMNMGSMYPFHSFLATLILCLSTCSAPSVSQYSFVDTPSTTTNTKWISFTSLHYLDARDVGFGVYLLCHDFGIHALLATSFLPCISNSIATDKGSGVHHHSYLALVATNFRLLTSPIALSTCFSTSMQRLQKSNI